VTFESFNPINRERLAALRHKISATVAEPYRSAYPDSYWGAAVSVTTMDGETLKVDRRVCKGDPDAALSRDEMVDKAFMLMRHGGMTTDTAQQLIAAILALPSNRADWDVLQRVFV